VGLVRVVGLFGIFQIIFKIPFQFCDIRKLKPPPPSPPKKNKKNTGVYIRSHFSETVFGGGGRESHAGFLFSIL